MHVLTNMTCVNSLGKVPVFIESAPHVTKGIEACRHACCDGDGGGGDVVMLRCFFRRCRVKLLKDSAHVRVFKLNT